MTVEDEEGQIHALQVLQYEDEDQDKRNDARDERSPGPAEARQSVARIRLLSVWRILRRRAAHQLVIYTPLVLHVKPRQCFMVRPVYPTNGRGRSKRPGPRRRTGNQRE